MGLQKIFCPPDLTSPLLECTFTPITLHRCTSTPFQHNPGTVLMAFN
jgi:hypothetical protein